MNEPSESATSIGHIAALLIDLGSNSEVARKRAHQELVFLQEAAVEPLIGALCTSTEYGRGQAAKALGEIGDSSAAPALAEALADEKFDVRSLATRAMVLLGGAGLTALLQALVDRPHSTLLRESAQNVLHDGAQEKWTRQLDPVIRVLEGSNPETELPIAATNALQAIRSQLTKSTIWVAGESR
jgi:HEAT repeat protein